nr:energy transducer TonB [Halioxenophilus sp. WMMB6]
MFRVLIAAGFAVGTTIALFALMAYLIQMNETAPKEEDTIKIADITMPQAEIETRYEAAKPDKPEEPDTPPPETPEMEVDTPDVDMALNISAPSTKTDLSIKGLGGFSGDGEYLPIVKVQPVYPRRALQRGIEGYVIVEFTVTKSGSVRDPVVVEADPPNIFDSAAISAALKFKYKPRVVDGEPIEVPGVQNKITFAIAD